MECMDHFLSSVIFLGGFWAGLGCSISLLDTFVFCFFLGFFSGVLDGTYFVAGYVRILFLSWVFIIRNIGV